MSAHDFQAGWMDNQDEGTSQEASKSKTSSGTWQALGVSAELVRALRLRGFKNPTPIQRAAIPSAMSSPPRDVLGMARTGSGKTLAYLIPLLHRLGGARVDGLGTRALILCPSRELAVQVLKAGKDLSRSLANGSEALRWTIVMGGESLDAQFEALSSRPDIVIATPGRLLHLAVEMDLDFRAVETVIYDEADRLFEMGFELQLREILHRLPSNRHSLLFSATLPSSLAEFAKAGLNNPEFIRLDTDHRISPDLKLALFTTKPGEKDAALLILLREVIHIPVATAATKSNPKAIIFASTKHHVEYLSVFLQAAGYRVSYIYGSLDQVARQQQMRQFRQDETDILVVTDVAARGLDIPTMGHVINFDFPAGVRVFVHRVGRTARAGNQGHAWTLVTRDDIPYLHDLEVFLERPLVGNAEIFGSFPREDLESAVEFVHQSLDISESQLPSLREVMKRGQSMFERSRTKASRDGYKILKSFQWQAVPTHPTFAGSEMEVDDDDAPRRESLLASIQAYNPSETIFEIGARGQQSVAALMKQRRVAISRQRARTAPKAEDEEEVVDKRPTSAPQASAKRSYRDPNFFLPHENVETNREKGYSLNEGTTFAEQARSATLDLNADEGEAQRAQKASQMKWDRKTKRFVKGDGVGSDNKKMIRGESGALLPATFKSGRFATWKQQNRHSLQADASAPPAPAPKRHKHKSGQSDRKTFASAETILKDRQEQQKRKQKNARAPRKRK